MQHFYLTSKISDVLNSDFYFENCRYCYKRTNYNTNTKKHCCYSCQADFLTPMLTYKLCVRLVDPAMRVIVMGSCLDLLFGCKANMFKKLVSSMDKHSLKEALELSLFTHSFIFVFNTQLSKLQKDIYSKVKSKVNVNYKCCHVQLYGDYGSFVSVLDAISIFNHLHEVQLLQLDAVSNESEVVSYIKSNYKNTIEMLMEQDDFSNLSFEFYKNTDKITKKKTKTQEKKLDYSRMSTNATISKNDMHTPSSTEAVSIMRDTMSDQSIMDVLNSIENSLETSKDINKSSILNKIESIKYRNSFSTCNLDDTFDCIIRGLPSQVYTNSENAFKTHLSDFKSPSALTSARESPFNFKFITSTSTPFLLTRSSAKGTDATFQFEDSTVKSIADNSVDNSFLKSTDLFENSI